MCEVWRKLDPVQIKTYNGLQKNGYSNKFPYNSRDIIQSYCTREITWKLNDNDLCFSEYSMKSLVQELGSCWNRAATLDLGLISTSGHYKFEG
jgi:hypothetical protein